MIEEMVYSVQRVPRVVLAAILKTIADFCSLAVSVESGRKSVPGVGAILSGLKDLNTQWWCRDP